MEYCMRELNVVTTAPLRIGTLIHIREGEA